MDTELDIILKDLPAGPLDIYRKSASFKWQDMKLLLEPKENILLKVLFFKPCGFSFLTFALFFQHKIWKTLENDPLFHHSKCKTTLKEFRHLTLKRVKKLIDYQFLSFESG